MTLINKGEIIDELVESLRLDVGKDKIPKEVSEKIVVTYDSNEKGKILEIGNAILNSSNKSFTVPVGKVWRIMCGHSVCTTDAAVGARLFGLRIEDNAGNAIYQANGGATQAASLTYHYAMGSGINSTTFVTGRYSIAFPADLILPEGYVIRFWDVNAVAAAADDMTLYFLIREYSKGGA